MEKLLKILGSKYLLWALIVAGIVVALQLRSCQKSENDRMQIYNRQLQGQLSDMERELQDGNSDLDVMKSELMSQEKLYERIKSQKEEVDKDFDNFKKRHNLQIKSMDKTIASLKQKINGGNTNVIVKPIPNNESVSCDNTSSCNLFDCSLVNNYCSIAYEWEDNLGRFKLKDPSIFNKNDEIFTTNQLFKVYGEIYEEKNGSLQIRRLVLREVYLSNGKYKSIENGEAKIIESKFEYHNPPPDPNLKSSWKDLFKLRVIALASINIFPDSGLTRFGVGLEFFNWSGLGINTHTLFSFQDVKKIAQHVGISYSPKLKNLDLNVAIGVSVGTPFANLFRDYSVNAALIFYLNN